MKTRYIAACGLTVALGLFGTTAAVADTTNAPALNHEAVAGESATAEINVTSSDALAGESLTVLITNDDADSADPTGDDVVFIEQYELDDTGATHFAVQLPTDVLEDYDIALNTAAGTDRYVAPLAGETDPDDDATEEPDDGSTEEPDDGATEQPDEGAPTDPDDGQGGDGSEGDDGQSGADDDASQPSGEDTAGGDTDAAGDPNAAGPAADGSGQSDSADQSSDGFLASTGASITIAVLIGLVAIGLGVLMVARRRKTAAEQYPEL